MTKNRLVLFFDALLPALRTTGALLLGNAVLVSVGVIGQRSQWLYISLIGTIILIGASIPWGAFFTEIKEE
jgi:hypothetical protein